MRDKPRLGLIKLLNDLADVHTAMTKAGMDPDQVDRITLKVARERVRLRCRTIPEPPTHQKDHE